MNPIILSKHFSIVRAILIVRYSSNLFIIIILNLRFGPTLLNKSN